MSRCTNRVKELGDEKPQVKQNKASACRLNEIFGPLGAMVKDIVTGAIFNTFFLLDYTNANIG